jgi:hypothetical protein
LFACSIEGKGENRKRRREERCSSCSVACSCCRSWRSLVCRLLHTHKGREKDSSLSTARTRTAGAEEVVFVPSGLVVPEGAAVYSPAQVGGVVARLLSLPLPPSMSDDHHLLPTRPDFRTLVGPSAVASVHMLAVAPSALGANTIAALAAAKATRVPISSNSDGSGAAFPGWALSLRATTRVASSDEQFVAAFPDASALAPALTITESATALAECGVELVVSSDGSGAFTISGGAFTPDDAAWASELGLVCAAASTSLSTARFVAIGVRSPVAAALRYG